MDGVTCQSVGLVTWSMCARSDGHGGLEEVLNIQVRITKQVWALLIEQVRDSVAVWLECLACSTESVGLSII